MVKLAVAREITLTGPEPEPGTQFCVLCLMRFKATAVASDSAKQAIEQAEAGIGPDTLDLRDLAPDVKLPVLAVGLMMTPQFQGQLMPCCWSHGAGVNFTNLMTAPGLPQPNGGGLATGRR